MNIAAYDVVRANAAYRSQLIASFGQVFDSGQLILGARVESFEQDFARFCGVSDCVGVGNGLDALALALRASGIGPGDEVIVPAFTFAATWFAASQVGAKPVPVDVRWDGLIDPDLIAASITPHTRAIVPVHLFGALADMEAILAIGMQHGIPVIEDAAQAHGANHAGRRAGSFGVAAAFSFYPTKNLGALGDGGAVCTNNRPLADRLRKLRNYGSIKKYLHDVTGQNSRLDELQAAFLALKLFDLDAANRRRRQIAINYLQTIGDPDPALLTLPCPREGSVWHQFVVQSPYRDRLKTLLLEQGVETLIHYPVAPVDQPCFAQEYNRADFPVATRLAETVLSLPMGDYLTEAETSHVARATRLAVGLLHNG